MKDNHGSSAPLYGHTKKPWLKIVREKCLECCVYQPSEVKLCAHTDCPLWPYRMGENPFRKHKLTTEQKKAATKRLPKSKPPST